MSNNNNNTKFYIDGVWVAPAVPKLFDLVNPATEETIGAISLGPAEDVDRAVIAARKAFATYSQTSKLERLAFLRKIIASYKQRFDDIARAITEEMGSPRWFSKKVQVQTALDHFEEACRVLEA
jgi:aldehyde dehydrogenase (NAD+)